MPLTAIDPTLVAAVTTRMLVAVLVGMMPVFPGVPLRLRAALAVLLAGAAVPAAVRAGPAGAPIALVVVGEAVVGLGLGLGVAASLAAAAWAGSLLGTASGLAWAADFDPHAEGETAGMARLAWWLGLGGFLAAGGHLAVVAGFIDSVRSVPVGACLAGASTRAGLADHLTAIVSASFSLAIAVALPALVAVVAAHAAAAVCMRTIRFEPGQGIPQAVAALVLVGGLLVGADGWIRGFGQAATAQVERSLTPRTGSTP